MNFYEPDKSASGIGSGADEMISEELDREVCYLYEMANDAERLAMIEMAVAMASGADVGVAIVAANMFLLAAGRKPFTLDYIIAAMKQSETGG